jgi:putative DNA primase/helicase
MASKDRPYRMAKFVYQPKEIGIVPVDLLRELVAKPEKAAPESPHVNGFKVKANSLDRDRAYGQSAIEKESAKLALCPIGKRHNQLVKSSFALWELVAGGCLTGQEVLDGLFVAACRCGLDEKEYGEKKILATINSCREKAAAQPRNATSQDAPKAEKQAQPIQPGQRLITLASEITPRKIQWLWQGRIPLGMMTTFAGSGGLGKTFVLTDIAARVSRGDDWPDGAKGNSPGKVLYVSGEDNADDTLVPRLIAAGGVRENVAYFKPEVLGQFSLERLDMLDAALDQLGQPCHLVCIDPPTSFLAGTDDHKNSELRELLTPLSEWAARRRVSVVFITHINKGGAGKVDAVMRIIGSVAWSTAVRAAHMFAQDPDDPEKCLFLVAKINGAKRRNGIGYRIHQIDPDEVDGTARVEWLGEVDMTANEAMAGTSRVLKKGERAAEWLVDKFREKLEWNSEDLFTAAKEQGVSRNAIFEAKEILQLPPARRNRNLGGEVSYQWWVPSDWHGFDVSLVSRPGAQNDGTPGHQGKNEAQDVDIY